MALTSLSPFFCPLSPPSLLHNARLSQPTFLFLNPTIHSSSSSSYFTTAHQLVPSCGDKDNVGSDGCGPSWLSEELLRRLSGAKDADEAMEMIVEGRGGGAGGEVGSEDCRLIIAAAFERGNVELALSVFHAMRLGVGLGISEKMSSVGRWTWARPDVRIYALLVQGLAASLRVSDAIKIITYVSGVGLCSGEEVPFGMIVQCPVCTIAIAVAQPQQGIQVASCSKCRYQYQLVSGDIVSIESEVVSTQKVSTVFLSLLLLMSYLAHPKEKFSLYNEL